MALFYQAARFRKLFLLFSYISLTSTVCLGQNLPGPGNSLAFAGFNFVSCGTSNRGITSQVTAEAWIKTTSSSYQWIVGKYLNSLSEEKGFHLFTNNGFAYLNGRIGQNQYISSGASKTRVNDGRWHHIAGTSSGNVWRIYVDGVLENTTTYTFSQADFTTSTTLSIGNYEAQNGQYFSGEIDEVRVWRTVRSAADIQQSMCRKFATAPAELVAYYRLDQSSGLTATDQGSQPTNGALISFAGSPWHLSGAALGDASVNSYQGATRLGIKSASGDSAVVSGVAAGTQGVQLYTVASAPSIAPSGGGRNSYFGVFTTGTDQTYAVRLRLAQGLSCAGAQLRGSNDLAWNTQLAPAVTATSLLYGALTYRGEYILTGGSVVPPLTVSGDSAVCAGATGRLTAAATGATGYSWNTGATTATITGLAPGTYTVTASFAGGCSATKRATIRQARSYVPAIRGDSVLCPGGAGRLTASAAGPVTYRWSTGATSASIAVSQTGTYTVTATSPAGCSQQASFRVRVAPAPTLNITGNLSFCPGSSTQLTAVVPAGTAVRWSTGATTATIVAGQAGTYAVTATSAAGCTSQAAVQVRQLAAAVAISGSQQLCAGVTGQLVAAATGATAYSWNTGATTATVSGLAPGTYTVTATFAGGCTATAQATIGLAPAPTVAISGDSILCGGTTAHLTATATNAASYLWSTGATTASIDVTQASRYTVTVTSTGGCQQQATRRVRAGAQAPAFTLGADTTLCEGAALTLSGPAGTGLRYQWSDGSTSQQLLVATAGSYTLRVAAECGTTQATRVVSEKSCLTVPNVFTPNNDHSNDLFVVQGLTGNDWSLDVYDRWGRMVLHTRSYHNDWGQDAAPGVYYLLLRHPSTGYSYKGWVEVMR